MALRRSNLMWVSRLLAVAVVALVALTLLDAPRDGAADALGLAILGAAVVPDLVAMEWFRRIGVAAVLSADSNEELVNAYRRRLVVSSILAMSPALVGSGLSVIFGHPVYVVVGGAVSLLALAYAAPRRVDVEALDRRLTAAAKPFRLGAALGD